MSGTHLDNEVLVHMPQLHIFTFYIASENVIADPVIHITDDDIQRTFTNIKYQQMACIIDYFFPFDMTCRVFSLPFKFHLLENITNNIPNIIFNSVTVLKVRDKDTYKHEFFIRLTRAFPFLQNLYIWNIKPPILSSYEYHYFDKNWCSIIEYPHLISLDIKETHPYYVEHFLNETKTRLPHLTELSVTYNDLKIATENFTRDETRRNCARVKQLIVEVPVVYPENFYHYFPLLSV
jgi:hypothetical protein